MLKWVVVGLLSWITLAVLFCVGRVIVKELEGRR